MRVYSAELVLLAALAGLLVTVECRRGRLDSSNEEPDGFEKEDGEADREGDEDILNGSSTSVSTTNEATEKPWSSTTGDINKGHFGMPGAQDKKPDGGPAAKGESVESGAAGKEVDLSQRSLSDWLQLILNPAEFTKAISVHFKLSQEKLIEKLGKGLVFGLEAMLRPLVATLKIVEKVFVPDACRLFFVCQMGSRLELIRATAPKLSNSLLEGSSQLKAFSEGVEGKNCSSAFPSCEPSLKKDFVEPPPTPASPSEPPRRPADGSQGAH